MSKKDKSTYQINGRVIESKSGRGIPGLRVEAWDKDLLFDDLVGSAVTGADGHFVIEFTGAYYREIFFDREPDLFFKVFYGGQLIKSTEDSVLWNVRAGSVSIEIAVPWTTSRPNRDEVYTVSGAVVSRDRPGVGGLRVAILDKSIPQDTTLVETVTDNNGRYETSFAATAVDALGKERPDLQARVYAGNTLLASSEVRYNATSQEILNVLLPPNSEALPSEYDTLIAGLAQHYSGRLADLKETDDRQDITYLANKSGWDARAVALVALADQFSGRRKDAAGAPLIKPAFYYALFRAGLPANEDMLYQADAQVVERTWRQAIAQGVIAKTLEPEIEKARDAFGSLSAQKLLTGPSLAGASSLGEILAVSKIEESQQQQFAELYTTHRTDLPGFWDAVKEKFGEGTANRLQVNGKLAFLTVNNAPLITELHKTAGQDGLSDPVELAHQGYHRAEKWEAVLTTDISVPKEIPGETPVAKRANYAKYLAAQVRLSYPTAAVAEMVSSGDLAVGASEQVNSFLVENQGSFEIGMMPVQKYIKDKGLEVPEPTVTEVKRLQRVYQITSDDVAMSGLLKTGMDAAYRVVSHDKETFVRNFSEDLGGAINAEQTYDRSVHVHNAVLNIAVTYLTARNGLGLGAPPLGQLEAANTPEASNTNGLILQPLPATEEARAAGDVIAYPTLEELFGEMDFCACEHCRSILSPAAYLVDLLLFIDQPFPSSGANPQTVLLERRPDIQHLPLTCENTNTALPYIDVVNETLEYFIANTVRQLSLDGYLGHDTDGLASEDLLASPQFVMDSAYTTLRNARFPTPLPFHQPLESIRRYFDKFEVPLPLAMQRLRKSNALERGTDAYGWRDTLMETVRLSRSEYEMLVDSAAVPLWRMYGFPNGTSDADVIAGIPNFPGLSNAKQFTRRVGITYEDLAALLQTRFINPNSDLIPKLERLGVSIAELKNLKDTNTPAADAAFDALLPGETLAPDPAEYGGDIKAWVKNQQNFDRIMGLITLTDPTGNSDPCNFDTLEFRYARPDSDDDISNRIGAVEFVRLLRFIRLWRKLGWTIEQTDAALCALFPVAFPAGADDIDTLVKLDNGFLGLLPRLGIAVRMIKELNLKVKRDLLSLLTCWSPIGTHGDSALYRQMFLNPTLLNQDAAFADNGYGEFLKDTTQKLLGHAETLRAAFGLTGAEFSEILGALGLGADTVDVPYNHPQPTLGQPILKVTPGIGYDDVNKRLSFTGALSAAIRDALKAVPSVSVAFQNAVDALYAANQATLAPLTLDNISAVYRHGWLARKLKLSAREFLLLKHLTGLDPFATQDPTNPAILRIIELVHDLKERAFKTAAALYLIWNQDLSGKSAPDPAQVGAFARTLRLDLAAIATEFDIKDDPDGAIAQNRMTLVYGSEAAAFFFGLLSGTSSVDVHFTDPDGTLAVPATRTAIENAGGLLAPGVPRITYDDFRKRLAYAGVLTAATRDAIKLAAGGGSAAFETAVDDLFTASQAAINPFFDRYPELRTIHDAYVASTDPVDMKRAAILTQILPDLIKRRKRQQALQSVSAAAQTDFDFARILLDTSDPVKPLHAAGHDNQPALDDILALEVQGLSVQFLASDTATGTIIPAPSVAANLDYAPVAGGSNNPLPANPIPANAISGIWSGYLEAPESGFFNLLIDTDAVATVKLKLDGKEIPLTQTGTLWHNTGAKELRAGSLYAIGLTVEKVRQIVRVQWEWAPKGQGRAVISPRYLYPATLFEAFRQDYVRFLKASGLATTLKLTANEMAHFATHADYRINAAGLLDPNGQGWLNHLPTEDNLHLLIPAEAALAQTLNATLLTPLRHLLHYARMKSAISPTDESLLKILEDPITAAQPPTSPLFTLLTRWDQKSLDDLLALFGGDLAGLSQLDLFHRVYEAFELTQKMGISARALIAATTNEPTGNTVQDLRAALRARYDAADWRSVVQPINDSIRALQRDALVTYILNQMQSHPTTAHIDTADKLFEYFLMDVQMEPCMQTSRIRHALSSVQLFIERCLMNLETRVSSGSIIAKQWEWMKRYRVWEANRKVFLFPENWLEPELRDDKSPFFKEMESELLQSDITEESASIALLNYLGKLEEVAKLEPCGIHHIPGGDRTSEIDHVVARTTGAHRKYYYRCRQDGSWTPWEQIKLDIEDNPVLPVVWRGRLFLFWLRLLKKGPEKGAKPGGTDMNTLTLPPPPKVTVLAILNWSEFFNGKWQPIRTSDPDRPLTVFADVEEKKADRSTLQLSAMFWTRNELRIIVSTNIGTGNSFFLHNVYSSPELREEKKNRHFAPKRMLETATNALRANYPESVVSHSILDTSIEDRVVEPHHPLVGNPWDAPFFYEDRRHVFFVTTEEHVETVNIWSDIGVVLGPTVTSTAVLEIPPLIMATVATVPDLGGPITRQPGFGVTDPAPVQYLVTEDAYISRGIGTLGTVTYGEKEIGPMGSVTKSLRSQ